MKNKIILATSNPHKIEKLRWILQDFDLEIKVAKDRNITEEGNSFQSIAENKALAIQKFYPNDFVIATDGGMSIPGLENSWNELHTKRFVSGDDFLRMKTLLTKMETISDKSMIWNEAIAIVKNNEVLFSTQVQGAKGIIQKTYNKEKYKPGIWLCSLWFFPQFNKNFFDLNEEEKKYAEISWFMLKEKVDYWIKETIFKKIKNN